MTVDTNDEHYLTIRVTRSFRDKVAKMIDQVFITGKRCSHSEKGREVKPHQLALIEAAWEVAQRHPGEFTQAIMRRTHTRGGLGIRADHLAGGHRPR